ncbi:cobalamin biosynthesis protein CbiD [Chlorobaculum parvum NCIB 8327]|uniref:Cobalt-precorrin-5B C(1)-methyltransferase n=1 Tax=Chlorobaculum parvum (strain DSM 263 / NCIMB 8327) TaxID=517417 RepID=B3QPL9_CHLP8|nr:cobalt-precorrin-5B (C(1))-methyltransferase CbiD [Chlorobaculum parvum]ACF11872.1 cobalamin biosynthesis protein CbiD [Chlorobaculum parvum NCIB 8327]
MAHEVGGVILLFGGTTEGRKAAALLDRLAMPFIYSTKTRVETFTTTHGEFRHGSLDEASLSELVSSRDVRLVIDAAHPFAARLHRSVFEVCERLAVRLIRFDRASVTFPDFDGLHSVADFPEALGLLKRLDPAKLLALTGVQSVDPLRPWWERHEMLLRILPSPASMELVQREGFPEAKLLPMNPDGSDEALEALVREHSVDCLLTKESGESGFFSSKLRVAERCGIPVIVIRRPPAPAFDTVVFSVDELQKCLTEHAALKPLRTGYTTGACAAAATKAAMIALLDGAAPDSVTLTLPSGKVASFGIISYRAGNGRVRCGVRKFAGDDPDVTHGLLIVSEVSLVPDGEPGEVRFLQGEGVGRVTLPGLEIPPGEPAINPVPRRMIRECVAAELRQRGLRYAVDVTISAPGGEAVARKTMNARLGITGGISILGTSGEVVPYSIEAWLASIRQSIAVAAANGCTTLALTSGLRSERHLRALYPDLPELASIHYGNFIGRSLELAGQHGGFKRVIVGVMLAKATKLAQGQADLSSRVVPLDPRWLATLAVDLGYSDELANQLADLHLVRNVTDLISFTSDEPLYLAIASACHRACRQWLSDTPLSFVLFDMEGRSVISD